MPCAANGIFIRLNTIMKVPVLGVTFCIFVLTIVGAVEARNDGRYAHSPLKPWFDGLRSGKDCAVRMLMALLFLIRIGNRKMAITASASITNGRRSR
ncbi:MAG: hypothetical protein JWP25_8890 [Bradyrhizobium sp.]|jgi:hypothetical protein|nr:hypothetical protein [Bradyrhizobium sp.]